MAGVTLYDYQLDAINRMKIGCILCGGVGSGKSRTSLAFYYRLYGGQINTKEYARMAEPPDLYIITTARKRDTGEWDEELAHFYMSTDPELDIYEHSVTVDSWNNIEKYIGVKNAFVIFDEQRVVGSGKWVKSFLKIAKENEWMPLGKTAFATFAPVLWFVLKKTSMASLKLVGFITLANLEPIISSYVTVLTAASCIGLLLPAFTGASITPEFGNRWIKCEQTQTKS